MCIEIFVNVFFIYAPIGAYVYTDSKCTSKVGIVDYVQPKIIYTIHGYAYTHEMPPYGGFETKVYELKRK